MLGVVQHLLPKLLAGKYTLKFPNTKYMFTHLYSLESIHKKLYTWNGFKIKILSGDIYREGYRFDSIINIINLYVYTFICIMLYKQSLLYYILFHYLMLIIINIIIYMHIIYIYYYIKLILCNILF